MRSRTTAETGALIERQARAFFEERGLRFVAANFRTRFGELDLVMEDGETLVFVEVRYRRGDSHGGALASVTTHKQQRLLKAAAQFLAQHGAAHRMVRFDIVGVTGTAAPQWLRDAFREAS